MHIGNVSDIGLIEATHIMNKIFCCFFIPWGPGLVNISEYIDTYDLKKCFYNSIHYM